MLPTILRNFQPGEQPSKMERLAGRRIRGDKHEDTGLQARALHALGPVNARAPLLSADPRNARALLVANPRGTRRGLPIADPPQQIPQQLPPRRYGK